MANIKKTRSSGTAAAEILSKDPDLVKELIRTAIQELLETEMIEAIGAKKGERTELRLGYRSGYYSCTLITRVGKDESSNPWSKTSPQKLQTLTELLIPISDAVKQTGLFPKENPIGV